MVSHTMVTLMQQHLYLCLGIWARQGAVTAADQALAREVGSNQQTGSVQQVHLGPGPLQSPLSPGDCYSLLC